MKRTTTLAAAGAVLALVATAAPASAIRYGEPDNGEHPYVGLMLAYVTDPDTGDLTAAWRCTGTQMDADTFLTAGHCTYGAEAVAIWYGDDVDYLTSADFGLFSDAMVNADAYSTHTYTNPQYDDAAFYVHDSGIVDEVVLNEGTSFDQYGALPEQGYWDVQLATRKKDRDAYDTVGYGLQRSLPDKGNHVGTVGLWIKLQSHGVLLGNRQFGGKSNPDSSVILSSNAHTGGTCSGDSGGPTFIDGTNVIVGVTSFGVNTTCAGTSGIYRIDTADDLAWIESFLD